MEEKIQEKQELTAEEIETQTLLDLPDRPMTANIVTVIAQLVFNLGGGGGGGAGGGVFI